MRREEAIRYYTAARMLRPETAHELAHALKNKGESEEAIIVFRDLVRIRPGNGRHLACLGAALQQRGRADGARWVLTEAVAVLKRTIAARPNDYFAHISLGNAFLDLDRLDDALAMYRAAARIRPGDARAPVAVGTALNNYRRSGKRPSAIARRSGSIPMTRTRFKVSARQSGDWAGSTRRSSSIVELCASHPMTPIVMSP